MDIPSFQQHLGASRRIVALVGAGLSVASGIPTFRGTSGAIWREFDAAELATPEAFDLDPQLVWQFYAWRRSSALKAVPNVGHIVLARLAQQWPSHRFLTLTQNVDSLSERAGHPSASLVHLHGDLFTVRCTRSRCSYSSHNFDPHLGESGVPQCPRCEARLRPGVVWFGEALSYSAIVAANSAIESGEVDLLLCIGMSASVWPAAGYIDEVVQRGGRIAVFNTDTSTKRENGWFFRGGAEDWLPKVLEPVIGVISRASKEDEMSEVSELSDKTE